MNKKCSAHRWLIFERPFFILDLAEETLEFLEGLSYQLLTPTIRLPNLSQRATQFTVCLNYKYGSLHKKYSNPGNDLCDI